MVRVLAVRDVPLRGLMFCLLLKCPRSMVGPCWKAGKCRDVELLMKCPLLMSLRSCCCWSFRGSGGQWAKRRCFRVVIVAKLRDLGGMDGWRLAMIVS